MKGKAACYFVFGKSLARKHGTLCVVEDWNDNITKLSNTILREQIGRIE